MNCQSFHLSNTEKSRNVFECRKKVLCIMERERERGKRTKCEKTHWRRATFIILQGMKIDRCKGWMLNS